LPLPSSSARWRSITRRTNPGDRRAVTHRPLSRKEPPISYFTDFLIQSLLDNWTYLALAGAGIAAVGAAVGGLKKLVAALFKASLNMGDAAAKAMGEKPKAVAVGLGVFALVITSLWAWHRFTAPKIVEVPVIQTVTVRDFNQPDLDKIEAERAAAERRAIASQNAAAAAERAKKDAESRAAELATKLREMQKPEGDDEALARLEKQMDSLHVQGVVEETMRNFDYRRYRTYAHERGGESFYHRNCAVCDQNFQARVKMDEIYHRQGKELLAGEAAKWQAFHKENAEAQAQLLTAFGETKTIAEWAKDRLCKVKAHQLALRIKYGWEPKDAITIGDLVGKEHWKLIHLRNHQKRRAEDERRLAK
jgi:hypothetical protein